MNVALQGAQILFKLVPRDSCLLLVIKAPYSSFVDNMLEFALYFEELRAIRRLFLAGLYNFLNCGL